MTLTGLSKNERWRFLSRFLGPCSIVVSWGADSFSIHIDPDGPRT